MYVVVIWAAVLIGPGQCTLWLSGWLWFQDSVRCGNLGGCVDRSRTVYVVVIWVAVLIGPGQCTLW